MSGCCAISFGFCVVYTNDFPFAQMETRRKKKVAVAMGLHKKLGVNSILACIDQEILRMVFDSGNME